MKFAKLAGAIFATLLALDGTPVLAQKMISVNRDGCAAGLRAFGELLEGTINPSSPPTHRFGNCEARDIRANLGVGGVQFTIVKLQWGHGDLAVLASGKIPVNLNLKIRGATVTGQAHKDPFWQFLERHSSGSRGIDADLAFAFESDENRLTLTDAALNFHGGNRVQVVGEIENIRGSFPARPTVFGLVLTVRSLNVSIRGTRRFGNDIVKAIVADMPADMRSTDGTARLAATLRQAVKENFATVLDLASMGAVNQMLDGFPHPHGTASLHLESERGMPILGLLALSGGVDAAKVLDGAQVTFQYDSNILAASN